MRFDSREDAKQYIQNTLTEAGGLIETSDSIVGVDIKKSELLNATQGGNMPVATEPVIRATREPYGWTVEIQINSRWVKI